MEHESEHNKVITVTKLRPVLARPPVLDLLGRKHIRLEPNEVLDEPSEHGHETREAWFIVGFDRFGGRPDVTGVHSTHIVFRPSVVFEGGRVGGRGRLSQVIDVHIS